MNLETLEAVCKLSTVAADVGNAGNTVNLQLDPEGGFFSLSVEDEEVLLRAADVEGSYDIPLDENNLLAAAEWLNMLLAKGVQGLDDHPNILDGQVTEDFLDVSLKGEISEGTPIVFPNPGKPLMFSSFPWTDEPGYIMFKERGLCFPDTPKGRAEAHKRAKAMLLLPK